MRMTNEEAILTLQEAVGDAIGAGIEIITMDGEEAVVMAIEALKEKEEKRWIPVSERLPEDFGWYLITLENGDVCQCQFNPDFLDEEHEHGAFTWYHQYFDSVTLGMIDEEEEAVDAVAWMPFEPYKEVDE